MRGLDIITDTLRNLYKRIMLFRSITREELLKVASVDIKEKEEIYARILFIEKYLDIKVGKLNADEFKNRFTRYFFNYSKEVVRKTSYCKLAAEVAWQKYNSLEEHFYDWEKTPEGLASKALIN